MLRKALHPNPQRRHEALSEFVFELRKPGPELLNKSRPPLLERDPTLFWQATAGLLAVAVVILSGLLLGG